MCDTFTGRRGKTLQTSLDFTPKLLYTHLRRVKTLRGGFPGPDVSKRFGSQEEPRNPAAFGNFSVSRAGWQVSLTGPSICVSSRPHAARSPGPEPLPPTPCSPALHPVDAPRPGNAALVVPSLVSKRVGSALVPLLNNPLLWGQLCPCLTLSLRGNLESRGCMNAP